MSGGLRARLGGASRRVRYGMLAAGLVVAGGVGGGAVFSGRGGNTTPAGETAVGNLWIDQNGGTCTRQGTAGAYVDAQACGTIQAAYNAASCGDIVGIKGGATHYPTQSVNSTLKDCSSGSQYVTFTPAVSENVVFGGGGAAGNGDIDICDGGSWMKFLGHRTGATSNFTLLDDAVSGASNDKSGFDLPSGACGMGSNEWVHHIWIEGLSFEQFVSRGGDNVTMKNNDIASGKTGRFGETIFLSNGYNGNYVNNYASNWLLEDNDWHGFNSDLCAASGCHVECMTFEAEDIQIINNHIWDCGNSGGIIFSSDAGFYTKGTQNLVEDNFIGSNEHLPFIPASTATSSVTTIRNNTFWASTGGNDTVGSSSYAPGQGLGRLDWYGNVFMSGNGVTCGDNNSGAFNYNVLPASSSGCTTGTGNVLASTSLAGAYPDYHLASGQSAENLVPIAFCASRDLDGMLRTGSFCDAGTDER